MPLTAFGDRNKRLREDLVTAALVEEDSKVMQFFISFPRRAVRRNVVCQTLGFIESYKLEACGLDLVY
jgi:hypothetical protein